VDQTSVKTYRRAPWLALRQPADGVRGLVFFLAAVLGCGCQDSAAPAPAAECGNGRIDKGEECDERDTRPRECGHDALCDVCSDACRVTTIMGPYCGDYVLDSDFEDCDEGPTPPGCQYGETACLVCERPFCQYIEKAPIYCGNGVVEPDYEDCEPPGGPDHACPYGQTSCTACSEDCQEVPGVTSYCGDNSVDLSNGEECDEPDSVDGDGCDTNCTVTACGNNVTTDSESCGEPGLPRCAPGHVCRDCMACVQNVCAAGIEPILVGRLDGFLFNDALDIEQTTAGVGDSNGLRWIDVSVPERPKVVREFEASIVLDLALAGTRTFVADNHRLLVIETVGDGVTMAGDLYFDTTLTRVEGVGSSIVYVLAGDLLIVDVSEPTIPRLLDSYGPTSPFLVQGSLAFVGTSLGFEVLDITVPTVPELIGREEGYWVALDIAVSGDYAFLAGGDAGLFIFDVSESQNPTFVSQYAPQTAGVDFVKQVAARGSDVFLRLSGNPGSVHHVNVSDPTNPAEVWTYFLTTGSQTGSGMAIEGAYMYLATGKTFDIVQICELPQ
jgi:hypothetical protein